MARRTARSICPARLTLRGWKRGDLRAALLRELRSGAQIPEQAPADEYDGEEQKGEDQPEEGFHMWMVNVFISGIQREKRGCMVNAEILRLVEAIEVFCSVGL